ncbi:Uncharacterised protein [Vibrio cholerae]|nr:Uncharacterised protein [Vibrio cholerae]
MPTIDVIRIVMGVTLQDSNGIGELILLKQHIRIVNGQH